MALFAALNLEKKVQINDKTRLDGVRSFTSKNANTLTSMTIKPGGDQTAISVFNSDVENRYLDWQFTVFEVDIDATNNKINFKEGGAELTATLTSATYTLAALATEIKTQLDAAGALTYTVSFSDDDKITISAPTAFSLLPNTGSNRLVSILPVLNLAPRAGFDDREFDNITTVTSKRVRSLPRAITVTIGDGDNTEAITKYIELASVAGDNLFSNDQDLRAHKNSILDWLPDSRNSFLHIHRRSQELILDRLNKNGYIDIDGHPLTVDAIIQKDDVKEWSIYMSLRIIHDELSNDPDDDFFSKARGFQKSEETHRERVILRLDLDNDGKVDIGEGVQILGGNVVRR